MHDQKRFVRSSTAISANVDGEEILLESEQGVYFGLNEVASRVWAFVEKPATVEEISSRLQAEYEIGEEECLEAVEKLLGELEAYKLIECTVAELR